MDLQIGSTVGDYQVAGILGAGAMGKVYKVRNVISGRVEAMKVLISDPATEPDLADRVLREIKVQASLEHPNIASLNTAVRMENQLLILMEFVEGVTLEQKLKDGPLPVAEAVDYIMQVLSALDYAHAQGVIHRDIKPANMMLTPAGMVKLMDFGIAKAAAGATPDARADIYSVGVSLYELATGKRPAPPISPDSKLPQLLNEVILMSVAKDPDARFQTAAAFRNALGNVAPASKPAPARPLGPAVAAAPARPERPRSKRGLWMGLGAVATALVVIGIIQFGPWKGSKAAPEMAAPVVAPQATAAPAPREQQPAVAVPTPPQVAPAAKQAREAPPVPMRAEQPAQPAQPAPVEQPPPQPAVSAASRAELQQAREQLVMLGSRANGIRTSLQTLQRSQAASGLNLRGDMQAAADLMNSYLDGANAALNAGDLAAAKGFMDKAERQIEKLEKFLNR